MIVFPHQMCFEEYTLFKFLINIWKFENVSRIKNGFILTHANHFVLFTEYDHCIRIYFTNQLKLSLHINIIAANFFNIGKHLKKILQHKKRNFQVCYWKKGLCVPPEKVFSIVFTVRP